MSRIIKGLAIYAAAGCMYYLWQFEGIEQAGHVFMFFVWAMAIMGSLLMFAQVGAKDFTPRPAVLAAIARTCALLVLFATIWAGHIAAASLYAIGMISMYAYGEKAKKAWEAAQ